MAQLLEVPKMTVLDDEGTLAGLPKTGDQNQRMVQVLRIPRDIRMPYRTPGRRVPPSTCRRA